MKGKIRRNVRAEKGLKREISWLQLLSQVTAVANEAENTQSALRTCIKMISTSSAWILGHVYTVLEQDSDARLVSSRIWFIGKSCNFEQFTEHTQNTTLRRGEGMIGRVLEKKQVEWIEDIQTTSNPHEFKRYSSATADGLRSAVAVPVVVARKITHVMEFYSAKPKKKDLKLIQVLEQIGVQIGRAVERERALEKLKREQLNLMSKSKLAVLGEMAAGIAHEISTPLSVIFVRTSQLKTKLTSQIHYDSKDLEWLVQIENTVKQITNIIDGLRNSARQHDDDPYIRTSLRSIVDNVLCICKSSLYSSGIEIRVSHIDNACEIDCRPDQVVQVLLNLISNAKDAIEFESEKWIEISAINREVYTQLEVTDSGRGIPSKILDKIFMAFFTTKSVGKGTGLGLSISKKIIESHGGSIEYIPKNGHTSFLIHFPRSQQTRLSVNTEPESVVL